MCEEDNEQMQRWGGGLFVFSLLIILAVTLFPYDFFFSDIVNTSNDRFRLVKIGNPSDLIEFLANILLFFPLGFGLTCLTQTKGLGRSTGLWVALAAGFCLSCTVEVLQFFLPSRFVSLSDVLANTIGSFFGTLVFRRYGRQTFAYVVALFKTISWIFTSKILATSFFGYATVMFLLSIPLQQRASLSNWDDSFPLVVGNEHSGNRLWHGYVSQVQITNRAVSADEAAQVFSQQGAFASFKGPILASYRLVENAGCYQDKIGNLPELCWQGKPSRREENGSVLLGTDHWLETTAPVTSLTQKIRQTSQFTISVTARTAETSQSGPARIVSLSADPYRRNFTLGQEEDYLVFRLRTPLTGENGKKPEFTVPHVFSSTNPHLLVVTYDGSSLRVYVDGSLRSRPLELAPGAALFSHVFLLDAYNMRGYKVLYYMLVFVPLGCLLAFMVPSLKSLFTIWMLFVGMGVLLPSFILENILVNLSGRFPEVENVLLGMALATGAMLLCHPFAEKY